MIPKTKISRGILKLVWIDESHDLSQKVPSREVLSTVPRLRGGFISYRHLSAVAELPTKDVDS